MKICVIGLGKLGLCTALCLKEAGYNVIGIDTNETTVEMINGQSSPIEEPQIDDMLKKLKNCEN